MMEGLDRRLRWLGLGSILLAAGMALNSLIGPLLANLVDYPYTETIRNEALGLELVTLVLVAPLAALAGWLALRRHRAAGPLAMGPAGYSAYMLAQYVVGPQYLQYQPVIAFHLALFVLSLAVLALAWSVTGTTALPARSRGWTAVLVLLVAFVLSRWLPALTGLATSEPVPAAEPDVTMYWSIFLLDLGIVVPLTVAVAVGLAVGREWATRALYGIVGWFALVPPSVAAMAIVKVVRDDPNALPADAVVLGVVSLVMGLVAVVLFRPLFARQADQPRPTSHT